MSEQPKWQPGSFCWVELMTRDVAAAKEFYTELIGWKMVDQKIGGHQYTTLKPPGAKNSVGGLMQMEGPQFEGVPAHWMPYIAADDIDAKAAKCVELGGEVLHPPTDIPGIGRFCVIKDPTGAVVSLHQSA